MSVADLWSIMPLMILGAGALVVLLLGAVVPGRHGNTVALVAALAGAGWALQSPPLQAASLGLVATPFARFFTILFGVTGALSLLISRDWLIRREIRGEEYPATILFATFGMTTVAAAGNLLILFLGLEALTFAFYLLAAMDRDDADSAEAGIKYLLVGGAAAAFTAFGLGLIYAGTGSLELGAMTSPRGNGLVLAGWGLLLAGLAFKVSLVPFHLWTPDVYEGAPTPVVAFLATGSKGAGVAALLILLGRSGTAFLHTPLWLLACLSMVVGNLAALRQKNLKRMLGYSAIAQMGYLLLALLTGTVAGRAASIFYLVVYSAMNLAAFGAVAALSGAGSRDLIDDYRGMGYRAPFRSALLALAMVALAGIPPTAGFTGKFALFRAALMGGEVSLAVMGMLTAAASVYYYLRVVTALYLRTAEEPAPIPAVTPASCGALIVCGALLLILGVWPGPLLELLQGVVP
jgi:NADH-quinone oxidoreductase subunit N